MDEAPRPTPPVVAILCPAGWGLRNMVHSGVTTRLHESGLATVLLARQQVLRECAPGRGTVGASAELLPAPKIGSERGHAAFFALLRASFARRYRISTYRVFNQWRRRNDGAWLKTRNQVVEVLSLVGSREPFYSWQVRASEARYRRSRDISAVTRQMRE